MKKNDDLWCPRHYFQSPCHRRAPPCCCLGLKPRQVVVAVECRGFTKCSSCRQAVTQTVGGVNTVLLKPATHLQPRLLTSSCTSNISRQQARHRSSCGVHACFWVTDWFLIPTHPRPLTCNTSLTDNTTTLPPPPTTSPRPLGWRKSEWVWPPATRVSSASSPPYQ